MARWAAIAAGLGVAALLAVGCDLGGRGDPPPSPTESLEPVIVGVIARAFGDPANSGRGTAQLEDGSTLMLGGEGQRQLVTISGQFEPGDLVLAGPGNPPIWWADLDSKIRVQPSGSAVSRGTRSFGVPDGHCWSIAGGAYDVGDAIHFSNGLLLPKAADFHIAMDYIKDPFPARSGDRFCVDRHGNVTSLDFIWQPF
jgi:hypothetical protein